MKRVVFIIALLCLGIVIACKKTETAESLNVNGAHARTAVGNNENAVAAKQTSAAQTNEAAPEVKTPLRPATGYVNDYANVIDNETKQRLEKRLADLKKRAQIEFAIVTVKTTGEDSIFDYSLATARAWGIGGKPGGGLLLMLAIDDRKWHIQVSRSLEADLPNETVAQLGSIIVKPFRAGKYGEGLTKCVEAIIKHLSQRRGFESENEKRV